MKPVEVCVDIDCPAPVVWEYLKDAERNPEWLPAMKSCRWITDSPIRVGSRYEQQAHFLGKEVRTTFEVTALEEGRVVTITSLPGSSFPLTITRRVDPLDSRRCRACETAGGDTSGFYRIAEPLMRPLVRRNIARAYRRLKALAENRPPSAGETGSGH